MTNKAFRLCFFNSESVNSLHVKKHSRRTLLDHGYPFIDPINKWLDNWDSGKLPMFYCKEIGMEMVSNFAESWLLKRQLFAVWLISKHEHAPISSAGSIPPHLERNSLFKWFLYTVFKVSALQYPCLQKSLCRP